MLIGHDVAVGLTGVAALVNSRRSGIELLDTPSALKAFLVGHQISHPGGCTEEDLSETHQLRERLRQVWNCSFESQVADVVNAVLEQAEALPQLIRHDDWGWHLHVARPGAQPARRLAAELAMALAELIRHGELDRLRRCDAPDCDAVLVDLSRNRSRLYCDTGNCGNRQHVAAYRKRRGDRTVGRGTARLH